MTPIFLKEEMEGFVRPLYDPIEQAKVEDALVAREREEIRELESQDWDGEEKQENTPNDSLDHLWSEDGDGDEIQYSDGEDEDVFDIDLDIDEGGAENEEMDIEIEGYGEEYVNEEDEISWTEDEALERALEDGIEEEKNENREGI